MGKLAKFIFFYTDEDEGVKPVPVEWDTVTGVSPLLLSDALAKAMKSLTQYGKCAQSGTPTPSAPVDIVCNNGALKFSPQMANVNSGTALVGYYISSSGAVAEDANNWIYQDYIPVKPSTKYTLSVDTALYYVTISEYSSADDSGFIRRNAGSTGGNTSLTITTRSNTRYIRFGSNIKSAAITIDDVLAIKWMLNNGDTALPYAPFVEGGIYADGTPEVLTVTHADSTTETASVENLLAVGDIADEQEIVSGLINRKIGVIVLDGTEEWSVTSGVLYTNLSAVDAAYGRKAVVCTHYIGTNEANASMPANSAKTANNSAVTFLQLYIKDSSYSTAAGFTAYLAAQYAAGTPVIVLYPMAEPITESVEPQPLHTTQGDNTVSWTAEVSGTTKEVIYYKGQAVAATVGTAKVGTAKI